VDPDSWDRDPEPAFLVNPAPCPDPGFWFDDKKNTETKLSCFDQKLQFYISLASLKNVQATGEAFSPKGENPALKKWNLLTFSYFCGSLLLFWIRIHNTGL
jgi:hypothetical protein